MIDIGYDNVIDLAEKYAEDMNFQSDLTTQEINEAALCGITSERVKETEEELTRAFGKFIAENDYVFGSVDFKSEEEREDYAYGYADLYYRKGLLKQFLHKRLQVLKKRGE